MANVELITNTIDHAKTIETDELAQRRVTKLAAKSLIDSKFYGLEVEKDDGLIIVRSIN